jgi:nucleoside-diphosphate-sugar epimerase
MFDAHYNNKIEIFGSGRQLRPFIEVTELSQLIASYCHSNISFPDILNAVTTNQSINDVAQVISSIYPQVNRVHLDQHLEMRSISATKSKIIDQYIDTVHIEEQLLKFKNLFRL